jgi:hypothetical protein
MKGHRLVELVRMSRQNFLVQWKLVRLFLLLLASSLLELGLQQEFDSTLAHRWDRE